MRRRQLLTRVEALTGNDNRMGDKVLEFFFLRVAVLGGDRPMSGDGDCVEAAGSRFGHLPAAQHGRRARARAVYGCGIEQQRLHRVASFRHPCEPRARKPLADVAPMESSCIYGCCLERTL